MSVHEVAEKIEHAAHGHEHGSKNTSRNIGVTMAILGVLVALASAMVGAERTDLLTITIEQSMRWNTYQAETTKFRTMHANYDLLSSLSPQPSELEHIQTTLREKRGAEGTADAEDTAELKELVASATEDIVEVLSPDKAIVDEFKSIALRYEKDMEVAKEGAECYEPMIKAHEQASEHYENALLAAEVGIVVASVALLLSSRALWLLSIVLGLGCTLGVGGTYLHTRNVVKANIQRIAQVDAKIAEAEKQGEEDRVEDDHSDQHHNALEGQTHHSGAPRLRPHKSH